MMSSVQQLLSKMVMQRKRLAREVHWSIRTHRSAITAGLTADLGDGLETGETMPDVDLLVRLVGRKLERGTARLDEAETACHGANLAAKRFRRRRGSVASDLYRKLVQVRGAFGGNYGAVVLKETLRFAGRTPRHPEPLAMETTFVIRQLSRSDAELMLPEVQGARVRREEWVAKLEPPHTKLLAILEEPVLEQLRSAREAKRLEIAKFDDTIADVLKTLDVLLELAGEKWLADRLRRRYRRPHRFRYGVEERPQAPRSGSWLGRLWQGVRCRLGIGSSKAL